MEEIRNYLTDQDSYMQGVWILEKHCKEQQKIDFYKAAPNSVKGSMHFKMLINELTRIYKNTTAKMAVGIIKPEVKPVTVNAINFVTDRPPVKMNVETQNIASPPDGKTQNIASQRTLIIKGNRKVLYTDLPDFLKATYNTIGVIDGKIKQLRAMVARTDITQQEREDIAQRLVSLDKKIKDGWFEIDSFFDPSLKKETLEDPEKLAIQKQINNCKANISKWKVKHTNALDINDTKAIEKSEAKLKEFEAELERLTKELK